MTHLLLLAVACSPDPSVLRVGDSALVVTDTTETQDTGACDTPQTWYVDADGDGHGDPDLVLSACEQPPDSAAIGDDCNDQDPNLFPEEDLCAAGRTCLDWLTDKSDLADGSYAVDPDGSGVGQGPVLAVCDMTQGGWMLVGLQSRDQQLTKTSLDIGLGKDWQPDRTHRWGTARVQTVSPTTAWRITSTGDDELLVDDAWFQPTCVIDWEVYVGTYLGRRDAQDDACGIAWTDESFTEIVGPAYTETNCSLGIGQNNSGAYCSIRMGSCNCYSENCDTTWAPEEGVATPCSVFDYPDYVMKLWVR
jgi:hypothetical protein